MDVGGIEELKLASSGSWAAALDYLAGLEDEGARREAIDRLAVAVWPELHRMATDVVLRADASLTRFGAEGQSVVELEFTCLLNECLAAGFRPGSFKALLWKRVWKAFGVAVARETGLSGTTAMVRKRRALRAVQSALRSHLGVEPTMQQIADRATEEAAKHRSDPRKQGMVFTADQVAEILGLREVEQIDDSNDYDMKLVDAHDDDTSPMTSLDRRRLVQLVLQAADDLPDLQRRAAQLLWLPQLEEDPVEFLSAPALASMVGCTAAEAQRIRHKLIHVLPARILADSFGITAA